jgi:hypothetical protein
VCVRGLHSSTMLWHLCRPWCHSVSLESCPCARAHHVSRCCARRLRPRSSKVSLSHRLPSATAVSFPSHVSQAAARKLWRRLASWWRGRARGWSRSRALCHCLHHADLSPAYWRTDTEPTRRLSSKRTRIPPHPPVLARCCPTSRG